MSDNSIPFYVPSLGAEEIAQLTSVIESTWVTSGPKVSEFERTFADFTGAPAALALHSCTAALHLSLVGHGIGPGDEVIVPAMTFCSTANVIIHAGASPVIVDVEPEYLSMDPEKLEAAITPRTRAVILVHYAGIPADLAAIRRICESNNLLLIEDAAHAFPAEHEGETIGSAGNPAAFSFYSTKNITTGEGGMLCGEEEFIDRARQLALHGLSKAAWKRYQQGGDWRYDVLEPGFKYNMTEMQAAIGLAQLAKVEDLQQKRSEIAAAYDAAFSNLPGVKLLSTRPGSASSHHLYVLRIDPETAAITRDQFIEKMREAGIATSVHFIPLHKLSFYREHLDLRAADLPQASKAFQQIVSLPLYPAMQENQIEWVVENVQKVLK
jgi:dTDP-4-amino-4,6-dideoxygalactose transaminase